MLPVLLSGLVPARRTGTPLLALFLTLLAVPAHAQTAGPPNTPILRIETGMHNAQINAISVDGADRYVATASDDKTVRVWDAVTGALQSTLRPPIGNGDEGEVYAVALAPDDNTVACGGATGSQWDKSYSIYLFDRATGALRKRLTGLPDAVYYLAYSPDGRYLAAALRTGGVRLFRTDDYSLAAQADDYRDASNGVAFGMAGDALRFAVACDDGFVRLYDIDPDSGALNPRAKLKAQDGRPIRVAFSVDGGKVAVGYADSPRVDVLSGDNLHPLYMPDTTGETGDSGSVCWSADGRFLYAGGRYQSYDTVYIRRWADGGQGAHSEIEVTGDTIFDIQPRQAGGFYFGAANPAWGMVDGRDHTTTLAGPAIADFKNNETGLQVSSDGRSVAYLVHQDQDRTATFSLPDRALTVGDAPSSLTAPVIAADGLKIENWKNHLQPTLNGQALAVPPDEYFHSLAITPDRRSFLLGSEHFLRLFGQDGTQKWSAATPSVAWAVNISGDGKLAVAAFGDGTIRWYRMSDHQELLAFFPRADATPVGADPSALAAAQTRWVLWTPNGNYDASPGGEDLIGWSVNDGADHAADFFPVSRFRAAYYRPEVVANALAPQENANPIRPVPPPAISPAPPADIAKTLPPVVAIESPGDDAVATTDRVSVKYKLRTPSGEPVTEVVAQVDGRPAQTMTGLSVVSEKGLSLDLDVPLPHRDCTVSVLAYNKFGASQSSSIKIHWAGMVKRTASVPGDAQDPASKPVVKGAAPVEIDSADDTVQPTLYILAVGIAKYNDPNLQLTYPPKDAQDFLRAMAAQKGKLYKDVVVYKNKALTDGDATREAILDGLDWLNRQTTNKDVAMLFLSGHGGNDAEGDYFFLPVGFDRDHTVSTGLSSTDITRIVRHIAGKVVFFCDSCHSGNVLGSGLKGQDINGIVNELSSAENGLVVYAASTGSESAQERADWGNGAFTKAVVEGIDGLADDRHKGEVTVTKLDEYVEDRVKTLTDGHQHPTMSKPNTVRNFPIAVDAQN